MEQLGLVHGDLMIGTDGSYLMVTGADRIRQDLTIALNDVFGTDRFHPSWGSIITSYLGTVNDPQVQTLVKAEVNRVLQNYLSITQSGVVQQSMVDLRSPQGSYSTDDVVRSVESIRVSATMDTIYITATLKTLAGRSITLGRKVSA